MKRKKKNDVGFFETFFLRCSLFRIWLVKNLYLFITAISLVMFIMIAFGVGFMLPFIGPFFSDVKFWNVGNSLIENIFSVVGGLIAPITASAYIVKKTKHLTLKDIKSNKTKIAMIKSNLYFNEHGKLTKRQNGRKIVVKEKKRNFIGDLLDLAKELKTAMTAKVEKKTVKNIENYDVGFDNLEESMKNETIIESLSKIEGEKSSAVIVEMSENENDVRIDENIEPKIKKVKKPRRNVFFILFGWVIMLFVKLGASISAWRIKRKEQKKSRKKIKMQKRKLRKEMKMKRKAEKKLLKAQQLKEKIAAKLEKKSRRKTSIQKKGVVKKEISKKPNVANPESQPTQNQQKPPSNAIPRRRVR